MDYNLSTAQTTLSLFSLPLKSRNYLSNSPPNLPFPRRKPPSMAVVVVAAGAGPPRQFKPSSSNNSSSNGCGGGGGGGCLNTPFEPCTAAGKFLSSVFQNQRQLFHVAVSEELKLLADDRDGALARAFLSSDSHEAPLHRRIAELKEQDCQVAVEDIMYLLIFYNFSEIRVPLVPKLSKCVYNGRLEIWPCKDWELESVHSSEILEMIKEHVCTVVGLRANSSVTDHWATTKIQLLQLSRVYAASILYGYFLKSASSRHHLERCLAIDNHLGHQTNLQYPKSLQHGLASLVFGRTCSIGSAPIRLGSTRQEIKLENLRCYVMGFDADTLQKCAKLRSKEAVNLIEKHSLALFGDKTRLPGNDEVILTSFSSLKRLVLEAVAFGSFLWDAEECVNSIFTLKENS